MRTDRAARRGFVLPTTLLVVTLLTVMLTAAFVLIRAEHRTTENSLANTRALALAQAGLQSYIAVDHPLDSTGTQDSVRIVMTRGYADVVAQRVRARTPTERAVWLVRAQGWSSDPLAAGQSQATRVVAQLVWLNDGTLPARSALVAINGVHVTGGGPNPLSGVNFNPAVPGCAAMTGPAADTFGVSVPTAQYSHTVIPVDWPDGEGTNGIESAGTPNDLYDLTRIDWQAVLNGQFTGDIAIPGGTWPAPQNSNYPTVLATGNVSLPSSGGSYISQPIRGVLVATGNVTVVNNVHWDGLIIAGGRLQFSGTPNYIIHGMVVTGLNIGVGIPVPPDTVTSGPSIAILRWSQCYARLAIGGLASLTPMRGTWVDTWTLY